MKGLFRRLFGRGDQKRRDALAGRASSGNLSPGERDRIFRLRRK